MLCLVVIELILTYLLLHDRNFIPGVNNKGLYPQFYKIHKSNKSKKIIFMSNQYLCLYPNELNGNLNFLHVS